MTAHLENAPDLWRDFFPFPTADTHKYSRGTVLIRGGSVMTGAARLAARAAQRMGAGLVTLAAPSSALSIYAESLESVIVRSCDTLPEWRSLIADARHPALLIGPGLGLGAEQKEEVLATLSAKRPTVLDADSLTNFADDAEKLFHNLHGGCVLTPHEGEFEKLFHAQELSVLSREGGGGGGLSTETQNTTDKKLTRALAAAKRAGCLVLLKGAETIIAAPNGDAIINRNAPPWLATAGAGDVLAGMILGLIAQNMPMFWATAAAAWMHGRIAAHHGAGLIAEDIVAGIPAVLQELYGI